MVKKLITVMIAFTSVLPVSLGKSGTRKGEVGSENTAHEVTITAYHPVKGQCSGNPLVTADGSKINLKKFPKNWISVSRDFLKEKGFRFGDKVYITVKRGNLESGVYEIHDTMHPRWRSRVDILIPPGTKAGKWEGSLRRA